MTEQWEPQRAVRWNSPLSIGLEGPPGGGKSVSSLLLAQGIQDVRGGDIILIDTENRAHKYAGVQITDPESGRPIGRPFEFLVVPFEPPFRANRYLAAIQAQLKHKPACIIVDSMSDEHNGPGGRLDWHEEEVDRILKRQRIPLDDYAARERVGLKAWQPSSDARNRLASEINRIGPTPLILTFRAEEKTKPVEQERNGRKVQVPTNIGYVPIAPVKIVHALDIMCLLPIKADGIPMWRSDKAHQDFVLKLPQQFRGIFQEGARITPEIGAALARWAKGEDAPAPAEKPAQAAPEPPQEATKRRGLFATAIERAGQGYAAFRTFYDNELTDEQRRALDDKFGEGLWEDARDADLRQLDELTGAA